jgi:TRAP transporter TAXI family solute receptor
MNLRSAALGTLIAAGTLFTRMAFAATPALPSTMAWSAFDVGSSGYSQAVAIGSALKDRYGISLRIVPGKNDVSRLLPLTTGKLDFVVNATGAYLAQEGAYEFGAGNWGPVPIRLLLASMSEQAITMMIAADTGVKTMADLRGKRVSWIIGGPATNRNAEAMLAFAGLTWDDVDRVEFGGYGATLDAVANGQSDAAFAISTAGKTYAIEKSPRGLVYAPMPASDAEGWARVRAISPYLVPVRATDGAGLSKDRPIESSTFPYPILHTLAGRSADLVHAMMRAVDETYPMYKDAAPGAYAWALDRQNFKWVIPYHEGAIRYFREKGLWTEAHQKHNDALVRRQEVLAEAWRKVSAQNLEGDAHVAAWQKARAGALREAGLPVVIESW